MPIKKIMLSGIVSFVLLANAYASSMTNDLCSKIPGHWQGIFNLKEPHVCQLYQGCTHLVVADVSHLTNNNYRVNINPAIGVGGEFNITCEKGNITSTENPNSKIHIACPSTVNCFVIYDDPRLSAEMMNH